MKFAPEYVSCVIEENFEDARRRCLSPLLAIHYAHVVMLAGRRIVTAEDARGLGQPGDRAVGLLVSAFTTKRVLTSGVWVPAKIQDLTPNIGLKRSDLWYIGDHIGRSGALTGSRPPVSVSTELRLPSSEEWV